jgi:ribosomal protein S25
MPDETAQTANTAQSTDSAPADVPLEAPQAPTDTVTPPLAKDDNLAQDVPESQPAETPQTPQTGEIPAVPEQKSEPIPTPETSTAPPKTTTAQTPPSEPLGEPTEPIFSGPAPTPAEPVSPKPNLARQLIAKAREAIQFRKRKKIDHILDLFAKRTNITNNEVADFLHVSDATATRYLQVLENENKIRQVGKTGKGVRYEKI